jgi:hypothetical protein
MSDQFTVEPAQVRELSQAVARQQDVPSQQGDTAVTSASAIDTGDLGLDSRTREIVGKFKDVLAEVTKKLTYEAQHLSGIADAYEDTDWGVADRFDQINTGGDGQAAPAAPAGGVPVASNPSIGDILSAKG